MNYIVQEIKIKTFSLKRQRNRHCLGSDIWNTDHWPCIHITIVDIKKTVVKIKSKYIKTS
jgi:hypothetical protein